MAPGPDRTLFVAIPRPGGSVLALLDASGQPRPGWPIAVKGSALCDFLLPVEDGSVRVLCVLESEGNMYDPLGAFSFDSMGAPVAGWPVDLDADGYSAGRAIGDELSIHAWRSLGDIIEEGQPASSSWIMTLAADGAVHNGAPTSFMPDCCSRIGPDAIAYGVVPVAFEKSRITALDPSGVRTGWPVEIDGIASEPAFGPPGRIVVTVGSVVRGTSRVLVFDRDGRAASAASAALPIATAESGVDCVPGMEPPLVRPDGTIIVYSWLDDSIFSLDTSLNVMSGWPFEPSTPLERPFPLRDDEGLNCSSLAVPAVGPDNILYLPLHARNEGVGGNIAAVGRDGRVRSGWPVTLQRRGAEFWSIVVGSDGTAYALAIEPEAGGASSASILAIAPDSTVLYTTTIIDP